MNRTSFLLIVAVAGATMLIGGCSPSAASAPTSASAVATQVKWPASGRSVTAIVPYAPGGTTDISARIVLPAVSSKLGNPVEIVNKPGGGAMVGNTQAATASPDGYTIDYTSIPTMLTNYMDPANKAVFTRTSFAPIARTTFDPDLIAVKADSPYHSLKDLVDAAKANPNTVTVAVAGPLSTNELGVLLLEQAANVSFAHVNFDGGGPGVTALLGGHVQASSNTVSEVRAQVQSGSVRVLGIFDAQESAFLPGVPTADSQGFKVHMLSVQTVAAPAGTPKQAVDTLSQAIKAALAGDDVKTKLNSVGLNPGYLDPSQTATYWEQEESDLRPVVSMELGKRKK